ncbi:MAG: helix-turn-helix transcriptional regulator, partial [Pseudobutyrivibrio sp.]|nr:helix-turn-helix transcriptional regulator [Pseudobutyrivibrio sp.]
MDVVKRIYDLMDARGWSEYKLSVEAGLSMSTIVNLRRRNTQPSVRTIEAICTA